MKKGSGSNNSSTEIVFSMREKIIMLYICVHQPISELLLLLGISQNTCCFYLNNLQNKIARLSKSLQESTTEKP